MRRILHKTLFNAASLHALTSDITDWPRYSEEVFYGVMLDRGCARERSKGERPFIAYWRHFGIKLKIENTRKGLCSFGVGREMSKGSGKVRCTLGKIFFEFSVNVFDADVPLLMSIDDLDLLKIYLDRTTNKIVHVPTGMTSKITRKFVHPLEF